MSNSLRSKKKKESLMEVLFVAPQFIIYFGLTILPFLIALPIVFTDRLSFLDQDVAFIGLQNFVNIFRAPVVNDFLPAVGRTAIFTIINYATIYIFGMSLALLMYEVTNKLKKAFFTVIYMPYIVSGLGVGMLLILLFSRDTGSINLFLKEFGIIKEAINIKDEAVSRWALPLLFGWRFAGFNMAIFLSGLLTIPNDTIDASNVDGANYCQRLRHIYFPQIIPCIMTATIMCLIGSFGIFDEPVGMGALTGNRSVMFLGVVVYKYGFGSVMTGQSGTLAQAITMSFVVYIPLFIIALLLTKLQKKLQY